MWSLRSRPNLRRLTAAASFSTSSRIALPISAVPTLRMLGCMMSAVRQPCGERAGDGLVDQVGLLRQARRSSAAPCRSWRSPRSDWRALAGDVGRRAVHRLVERLALAGLGIGRAERGRGQHADASRSAWPPRPDSMSPNRLSVTMTSNCLGLRTSCMAQASARMCCSSTSLASRACVAVTTSCHSTPVFMTLRFSAECTLLRALAGEVEGDAGDALDLVRGVDRGVDGALLAVLRASRSPWARRNRCRRSARAGSGCRGPRPCSRLSEEASASAG